MNTYLISIEPGKEEELLGYGSIVYESCMVEGSYVIKSSYDKFFLKELPFVRCVREDTIGRIDI